MKYLLMLGLALAGCSSNDAKAVDAANQDGAAADMGAGTFALMSTAFNVAGAIPIDNTCEGANTSPPLAWTGAPNGTQSFGVVLTDLSLTPELVHWVIYDIPSSATGLPAAVENAYAPSNVAGAHQPVSVHSPTVGYYGPCPPAVHMYQFAAYALDVAILPGTTAQTDRATALAGLQAHMLARGELTGSFTP